ncbi:MAG: hypothetical protein ACLF0G_07735 [Candidatus Brocadiia bacterium]
MKALPALALAAALALPLGARAGEKPEKHDRLFRVLDTKPKDGETDASLQEAVGKFDRALASSRSGEREAIDSNLAYNEEKLAELRQRAAAQREYLQTLWERVAVHFENLKKQFGGDTSSTEYRKAALALREEYQQREAEAQRLLDHLEAEIARIELRLASLGNHKKLAQIEQDLRATDLGPQATLGSGRTKPLPSRADEALEVLADLSQRKTQRRIALLVGAAPVQSVADQYFEKQIEDMLEGE